MNGRVCFLAREGDALSSARLVGLRTDDTWKPRPSESVSAEDARAEAIEAAMWIAERVGPRSGSDQRGIGFLCVDVDGSNCAWLTLPSDDPTLVAATLGGADEGSADWRAPDSSAASIQALAPAKVKAPRLPGKSQPLNGDFAGHRLAVLAVPDALARLVIDKLDDRGIAVQCCGSLWHAMALAWDPASPLLETGAASDRVIGSQAPTTAIVLIDLRGRIVWAWSRAGELLAGGVVMIPSSGEAEARVSKTALSRVTADWLGWSLQLGVSPTRIVCVATEHGDGSDEDMVPAQIGSGLGRAWAGATVDLAVVDDPISATLQRLAGSEASPPEGGRTSLIPLSRRPRRIHRAMYLWMALALALLAAGMVAIGYKAWENAGEARAKAVNVRETTSDAVLSEVPPPANDDVAKAIAEGDPLKYVEDRIAAKRASQNVRSGLPPARPILSEMESLSFVLQRDGVELEEIQLSDAIIHVYVYVPSTRDAEEILETLRSIADDHCTWTVSYPNTRKNDLQLIHLDGTWKSEGGRS